MNDYHVYIEYNVDGKRKTHDVCLHKFNFGGEQAIASVCNKLKFENRNSEIEFTNTSVRDITKEELQKKIFIDCVLRMKHAYKENAIYGELNKDNIDEFMNKAIKDKSDECIYLIKDRGIYTKMTKILDGIAANVFEMDETEDGYLVITVDDNIIVNEDGYNTPFKKLLDDNSLFNMEVDELNCIANRLSEIREELQTSKVYIY